MNVLLAAINAKYIHSNLAVRSLRACASPYQADIRLGEFTINQDQDEILRQIYEDKPDFVGFSCYIWNIRMVCELAENLRLLLPEVIIWAGGPEVSYDSREFLEANPAFNGVMRGEGERTFRALMEWYHSGRGSLSGISGITWRGTDGAILETPEAADYLSMDEIPFVYGDMTEYANKIIYYESSRGCPFSCSYCLSSVDRRVRLRSLSLVLPELAFFLEKRVAQVKFVDRTFNCNRAHCLAIWRFLLERDNGVTNFHFEIAADLLDDEEIAVLEKMRPGLVQLEIGVQSVQERTLEAIHRRTDLEKIRRAVEKISAGHNVHQHLDLIAGLPYETYDQFRQSFNRVYAMRPQEFQLGFLKVLKGSPLRGQAGDYGIVYRPRPVYEVLSTRWISYAELSRLKEIEEMLDIYYNSHQFDRTMERLERRFADAFGLYEELASFYGRNGLDKISLSRHQRLEALRDFCAEVDSDHVKEYDQRLIYDLYLRENAKTRPAWAPETVTQREKLDFFGREAGEFRYLPREKYEGCTGKQLARMVHAERFSQEDGEDCILLFDYETRDALTHSAAVHCLSPQEWGTAETDKEKQ